MTEIWKDIIGYEDSYQVSNMGRYRSKDRYRAVCGGSQRLIKGKILKPIVCANGYLEASIYNNQKRNVILLHRLVAIHFIPNPYGLPEVNHKDENIANCSADNLEWCTSKYNANYGTRNERCHANNPQKIAVNQYDMNGNYIKTYESISDAGRAVGVDYSAIIRVCKGKQQHSMGYKWKYAEEDNLMNYWFSENLKKYRTEKGLTQSQLAKQINVSQNLLCEWEKRVRYPKLDKVFDIARVLGVEVEDLLKRPERSVY